MQHSDIEQSNVCSYNGHTDTERENDNREDGECMIYKVGDMPYLLENHLRVKQVLVLDRIGDMYTVRIGGGAIRVRHTRLYPTKEAAEKDIIKLKDPNPAPEPEKPKYRSPYDYWY